MLDPRPRGEGPELRRILFVMLVLTVLGGGAYLAVWYPPPPARSVEIVVPDDRLPR